MRSAMLMAAVGMALAMPGIAARTRLSPERELARITRDAPAGKPTTCISLPLSQESQVIDGIGIYYKIGHIYYVNRLGRDCPLTRFDTLVTSIPSTQLCRGDIARVYDSSAHIPRGSCTFGDFTPYAVGRR